MSNKRIDETGTTTQRLNRQREKIIRDFQSGLIAPEVLEQQITKYNQACSNHPNLQITDLTFQTLIKDYLLRGIQTRKIEHQSNLQQEIDDKEQMRKEIRNHIIIAKKYLTDPRLIEAVKLTAQNYTEVGQNRSNAKFLTDNAMGEKGMMWAAVSIFARSIDKDPKAIPLYKEAAKILISPTMETDWNEEATRDKILAAARLLQATMLTKEARTAISDAKNQPDKKVLLREAEVKFAEWSKKQSQYYDEFQKLATPPSNELSSLGSDTKSSEDTSSLVESPRLDSEDSDRASSGVEEMLSYLYKNGEQWSLSDFTTKESMGYFSLIDELEKIRTMQNNSPNDTQSDRVAELRKEFLKGFQNRTMASGLETLKEKHPDFESLISPIGEGFKAQKPTTTAENLALAMIDLQDMQKTNSVNTVIESLSGSLAHENISTEEAIKIVITGLHKQPQLLEDFLKLSVTKEVLMDVRNRRIFQNEANNLPPEQKKTINSAVKEARVAAEKLTANKQSEPNMSEAGAAKSPKQKGLPAKQSTEYFLRSRIGDEVNWRELDKFVRNVRINPGFIEKHKEAAEIEKEAEILRSPTLQSDWEKGGDAQKKIRDAVSFLEAIRLKINQPVQTTASAKESEQSPKVKPSAWTTESRSKGTPSIGSSKVPSMSREAKGTARGSPPKWATAMEALDSILAEAKQEERAAKERSQTTSAPVSNNNPERQSRVDMIILLINMQKDSGVKEHTGSQFKAEVGKIINELKNNRMSSADALKKLFTLIKPEIEKTRGLKITPEQAMFNSVINSLLRADGIQKVLAKKENCDQFRDLATGTDSKTRQPILNAVNKAEEKAASTPVRTSKRSA